MIIKKNSKIHMNRLFLFTLIVLISLSCGWQKKKIEYLNTFAKVYGYVKYFHPSDEASAIDWNQFATYGAAEIDKCKDKDELIQTLNARFKPIAPTIKFSDEDNVTAFDFNQIESGSTDGYCHAHFLNKWRGIKRS